MMMIYSLYFLGGWLLSIILGISASAFWTLHGEIVFFFNQGFWAKWLDGQTFTPIPAWWFGTMEFYDFPDIGNFIIPTDFHSIIFQRGRAQPPTRIISIKHVAVKVDKF
jgi:hypothetical protein